METIILYVLISLASYLIGSLNSSIILSKLFYKKDIRNYGSGNGGLTNSFRTMGGKITLLVLIFDFAKGCIACLIGGYFFGLHGTLVAGVFVLLGHIFPVFFGFKGGKGVLTGAALTLMVDWRIFVIVIAVFIVILTLTRYVSVSSILATLCFPVLLPFICPQSTAIDIVLTSLIAVLVIAKHHGNIARLLNKTESKFTFHKNKNSQMTKD